MGWLEEHSKLENLTQAKASVHLIGADSWQVKMRMINRDTVLPRQVDQQNISVLFRFFQSLLFLRDETLIGLKRHVYVLIKILKFCTGSSAKSYQCRFAINLALMNRVVADGELGRVIREGILSRKLRGKFSSVHPELRRKGIIKVEVGDEVLHFLHGTLTQVPLNL